MFAVLIQSAGPMATLLQGAITFTTLSAMPLL